MITLTPLLPFSTQSKGKQPQSKQQESTNQYSNSNSRKSNLLQSLLKVSRQSTSCASNNNSHDSYILPSFNLDQQDGERNELNPIEELSWKDSKVIWSKGGSIYRTYTFKEQGQKVTQAIFATFEVYPNKTTDSNSTASPIASTSAKSLEVLNNEELNSSFGPFHRTAPPGWTDDPLPLPIHPTPSQKLSSPKLERFLVIFLSDIAFAYPPGGSSIPFQLPFHLRRAWALDKGLLLERAKEGSELFDSSAGQDEEEGRGEIPTLYSLLDPADEIKAVSSTSILQNLFNTPSTITGKVLIAKPSIPKGASTEPIQDLKESIVFVSDRKDGSEPVLVSINHRTRMISVFSYGKVVGKAEKERAGVNQEGQKEKGGGREKDLPNATTMNSKSRHSSTTTTVTATGKRKRQSSFTSTAHPDRILRRTSTINNNNNNNNTSVTGIVGAANVGILEEADLLEALGESLGTSMKRTTSNNATSTTVDRRTSLSRNELSITMDRMALSVGGNLGGVGLSGVNGMGEMDREWTIVMERDEERMVSDVLLEKVWELQIPEGGSGTLESITACVFDSRKSSDTISTSTLAICLGATSTLLLLTLSRSEDGRLIATPMLELSAKLILPVLATRSNIFDLIFVKSDGIWGLVTAGGRIEEVNGPILPTGSRILKLDGDTSRAIIITLSNDCRKICSTPPAANGLALRCLEVLSLVLPLDVFRNFLGLSNSRSNTGSTSMNSIKEVLHHYFGIEKESVFSDPWTELLNSFLNQATNDPLLALLAVSPSDSVPQLKASTYRPTGITEQHLFSILIALHLLAEDSKLTIKTQSDYQVLSELIVVLSGALDLPEWIDAYRRIVTSVISNSPANEMPNNLKSPVNLTATLKAILAGQPCDFDQFNLPTVISNLAIEPSNFYGPIDPLSTTRNILSIYSTLSPSSGITTSAIRAQNAALEMDKLNWTIEKLSELSFGISLPLRESLRLCQLEAPENWNPSTYELIRRPDLAKQMGGNNHGNSKKGMNTIEENPIIESIDDLCNNLSNVSTSSNVNPSDMNIVPKATRFNEDRRLEEVARMLQFSDPVTVSAGERTLDQLTPPVQQSVLLALSNRTLALPVGYAMFNYHARIRTASESVPILRINTSARILPMTSPVTLVEKDARDGPSPSTSDRSEWPDFHTGVAAALAQHAGSNKIDSAQISFNRPSELDARHAGFLMGLGLVGDISAMVFNQAFEYLKMKHDPTSIGLLLGLAVTYVGTSDPKVTSLLSVHLTALHPPRSSALNVSGITQSAGLVGIGLLYLGTQRRTLSDIMVKELCSIKVTSIEDPTACREAYALSAGFAFGMINLGKGKQPSAISSEVNTLRTFRGLILGESNHPLPGAPPSSSITDVNITSSAATIAIGLMYLRTERQDVADMLEIPDTAKRLDYVRSDLLLLRILARSIIKWESINSSKHWVESHIPKFIVDALTLQETTKSIDSELDIARWNIIAGACFAMGLKFAGTAAAEAHSTLIHYLDRLTRAAYVKATSVQSKIKRHAIRCCLSVIAISLSMVMAGTGEINVLRRLRVAHGHFSEGVTYGTHLASHMALGLLFVGSGLYTLGSSDCAIAAMLLAFYPSFPSNSTENRAHLQAYRHLWVLAVEPRCLQVKDVDTNEAAFLPIRLRLIEKGNLIKSKALVAPTLIPDIKLIESIQIDSPRYWNFNLNLISNSIHLKRFLKDGTIFVKRRTGHLSYAQDPRGIRSIFTRSKSETGSSVFDFGENGKYLATNVSGLRDFVEAFSDDQESIEAVRHLCLPNSILGSNGDSNDENSGNRLPTAFEAFSASVLLECLTRDKKDTIGVYQSIYQAFYQLFPVNSINNSTNTSNCRINYLTLLGLEQLNFILDFYEEGIYKNLFGKPKGFKPTSSASVTREPLIQLNFIDHVRRKINSNYKESIQVQSNSYKEEERGDLRNYFTNAIWPSKKKSIESLSIYLLINNVPALQDLQALKKLVQTYSNSVIIKAGSVGVGGIEKEEVKETAKLVLKSLGKKLKANGGKIWSDNWIELIVEIWLE